MQEEVLREPATCLQCRTGVRLGQGSLMLLLGQMPRLLEDVSLHLAAKGLICPYRGCLPYIAASTARTSRGHRKK